MKGESGVSSGENNNIVKSVSENKRCMAAVTAGVKRNQSGM